MIWNKLDSGLSSIYLSYLHVREGDADAVVQVHPMVAEDGRLHIALYYEGDLAEIEALGFETHSRSAPGLAYGAVDLANLERLAAHPNVLKLSFGESRQPLLDVSVPSIRANEIWSLSGGPFTGRNVIIGIVDTGIDIRHPFFLTPSSPETTRILRIWDQGLQAEQGDKEPHVSNLSQGATGSYGVEYDRDSINAALKGEGNFRHRDTDGHGTHVASIAAGNGHDKLKFVGVAPEADLIIVKHLGVHSVVSYEQRFRDAVAYVLNVAKNEFDKPVVVNLSFGNQLGPHDGLTTDEDYLIDSFDGASGQFLVASAGNDGNQGQHVRIEFPSGGGTVTLPFYLYDERTNKKDGVEELAISLYHRFTPLPISVQLKLPRESGGFVSGPGFGEAPVGPTAFGSGRRYRMVHGIANDFLVFTGRGRVRRNRFEIWIEPKTVSSVTHHLANELYFVKVSSPAELTVHAWCSQEPEGYGFQIGSGAEVKVAPNPPASGTSLVLAAGEGSKFPNPKDDGSFDIVVWPPSDPNDFEVMRVADRSGDALTVVRAQQNTTARAVASEDLVAPLLEVHVDERHQIQDPAGAENIMAVAAYNAEEPTRPIASFSSRGPLVDYGHGIAVPEKPDIAAPGEKIDAARSRDRSRDSGKVKKRATTVSMQGTSQAAPHVAGAVALMLQKDPQLTVADVIELLKSNVAPVVAPVVEVTDTEAGAGRLDAKAAFDSA